MEKNLLILMPVYNEEDMIEKVIDDWLKLELEIPFKILLVNDGSKDSSVNIINKFSLEPKECVYIGDTKVDQLAAKAAEIDFLFANWGYGPKPTEDYKELNQIIDLMNFI